MSLTVTDLYRYPVKSCRGERLPEAAVEPWGLAGDRRWMIVDPGGDVVTARERPRLLLVTPFPGDDAIRLTGPAMPDLTVPVPAGDDLIPVTVWDSKLLASPAGDAADAWLSEVAGEPVRLVYLDDPTRRRPNPRYSRDGDLVSFADGYPLLLTARAPWPSSTSSSRRARSPPRARCRCGGSGRAWSWPGRAVGRGRLAAAEHRRRNVPGRQGLRPVRDDHHRPGHRGQGKGADRDAGPEPALGRQDVVRCQPDPGLAARPPAWIRVGDPVRILEQADHSDGPLR